MKIGKKLLSGFLSVALLICIVGYFAIYLSQQALQRSIAENSVILASEILDKIDRNIYNKIISFRGCSKDLILQDLVLASNREFEKLVNIQKHINNKDREWTSVPKTVKSPFMQQLMNNRLSKELREEIEFYEEQYGYMVFGEVFVTNRYGANIAQTRKTSDYRQDDEEWWQNAKKDGLYVGDVEYDESSGVYSIAIGLRIDDQNGNFSGVMKVVLNIEDIINIIKKLETIRTRETTELKLINKDRKMIYTTEEYDFFVDLPAEIISRLKHEGSNINYFIAEGDKPGEGKELYAYAHSKGYMDYKGLGWILIVEHETEEILAPITKLRNGIMLASLTVTILAILIGFIISRSISKPVAKLRAATIEIGKGNLGAKIEVSSKDEIGMLANTFNKMTEDLQKTTVSKNYVDNIIQSMMDILIVLNPDRTIRNVNPATQKILGYPKNDLIGKDFSLLEGEGGGGGGGGGGGTLFDVLVQKGFIGQAEKTLLAKDGKKIPVLLAGSVMCASNGEIEAVVCVARDITERKRTEKELRKHYEELEELIGERTEKIKKVNEELGIEITDRKRAEETLRKSEEKYHNLIEYANDAILCTNKEGIIINFNKKAVEMFGYASEEIVGQSVVLLSPPSERERQKKLIEYLQTSNELYIIGKTMEGKGIRKDGKEFPYEGSTFKLELQGEFVLTVMLRDISERKKKEEELVKIRTALDNSSDAIAMTDINLKIVYQNQAFINLFGYTVDEIDRNEIPHVYKDINVANAVLQAIKSGKRWEGEIRTLSKDGREHTCLLSSSPIPDDTGNIIGYFSTHTDITDRKQMEQLLLQSEKLKSLGELAAGVAHDFNNVLAAILGRAQLLKMIVEPPPGKEEKRKSVFELKKGLEIIERASLDGAETVRRIQEFARRREEDKYFTTVNLNEIIDNALDFTRTKWKDDAESKGIKINIQKEFSTLPATSGSAAELREVFTNLINNALDAMPQGGQIKIKTFEENSHVSIKVEDTGIGIPRALRDRIFDPFFTTKGVQSTGLGMSVSYGIINRHRGTISVDSVEGQGTTFTIKLPIINNTIEEEKVKHFEGEAKKTKVLVIEDEEDVRDLLFDILKNGGHEVEMATSGSQGIEMFEQKEFDMVFTDLGMPGMSGWQVAEKVKSINGRVPVVLITGWNIELKEPEIKDNWVDLVIQKPFEMKQVLNIVQDGMILRDRFKSV